MRSYPTTIPRQWKPSMKEGAVQCKQTQGARLQRGGNSRHLGGGGTLEFGERVFGWGVWWLFVSFEISLCLQIKTNFGDI